MPIVGPLSSTGYVNAEDIRLHKSNVDAVSRFANDMTYEPNIPERIIFVQEGEIAHSIPESSFDIIGSDDATTCHIVLARAGGVDSNSDPLWLVAHLNSIALATEIGSFLTILGSTPAGDGSCNPNPGPSPRAIDVFVSGGLEGDRLSNDISDRLVKTLSELAFPCNILLWNTGSLNNRQRYAPTELNQYVLCVDRATRPLVHPHVLGLGYWREGRRVLPMRFDPSIGDGDIAARAHLHGLQCSRPPCMLLRGAIIMLGYVFGRYLPAAVASDDWSPSHFSEVCSGQTDPGGALLFKIDLTPCYLTLYSFLIDSMGTEAHWGNKRRKSADCIALIRAECEDIRDSMSLPADVLLQATSTSPHCEPSHFVPMYVATSALVLALVSHFDCRQRTRVVTCDTETGVNCTLPELLYKKCESRYREYKSKSTSSSSTADNVSGDSTLSVDPFALTYKLDNLTGAWQLCSTAQ